MTKSLNIRVRFIEITQLLKSSQKDEFHNDLHLTKSSFTKFNENCPTILPLKAFQNLFIPCRLLIQNTKTIQNGFCVKSKFIQKTLETVVLIMMGIFSSFCWHPYFILGMGGYLIVVW
jgi:hypothetical protein